MLPEINEGRLLFFLNRGGILKYGWVYLYITI
jgi:hypothetical protein